MIENEARSCKSQRLVAIPILLLANLAGYVAMAGPLPDSTSTAQSTKYFRPKNHTAIRAPKSSLKSASNVAIVNAASFLPGICPGAIASIFGNNLSTLTNIQYAANDPLPLVLGDITVFVNGVAAPLYAAGYDGTEDFINIQVPYETPTGLGAAQIDIYSNNVLVSSFVTDSYTEDPGIFLYYVGSQAYSVALHLDFTVVSPSSPALPGEIIVLYTTGLGPLDITLADGFGAPSVEPLARTVDTYTVQIGADVLSPADVLYSGLAPQFVGLYQLNLQLPSDLPAGDLPILISTPYASSGTALISIGVPTGSPKH